MRSHVVAGLMLLLLIPSLAGARLADFTWTIVSMGELDSRLKRQLEQLVGQDQALIRFTSGAAGRGRPSGSPGSLAIELHEQKNVETFLAALQPAANRTALEATAELAKEGYVIEVTYPRALAPNRLRITAHTTHGFHNALLRVPDLLTVRPGDLADRLIPRPQSVRVERGGVSAVIADFPSFPERGVVEGFYGVPWTHQDRLDVLRFEGAHGMNVYYYAPKDDPYHRKLWRDPYPPAQQKRLGELVEMANRNYVDFCFAISPGLTMAYSSAQDFQTLAVKLARVGKLGVSCFALFLDDVPPELQDPQDKVKFKTLAQAHVFLTNKLYQRLKKQSASNRLVLAPTTYTSEWGDRNYLKELGAGVDAHVAIVWTGPKVFSPTITVEQAREWGAFLHRKPLLWDNYPVNDATPWCRFLGPLTGRDSNLPSVLRGLFANPMNEARASMIPLQTIADFLWNAAAYDQAQSETHAVESQYGKDGPRLLAPFLKDYGTYYWDDGVFTPLFMERRWPIPVTSIQAQVADLNAALNLLENQTRLAPLLAEIAPAVKRAGERVAELNSDPAFRHLPSGELQWDENFDGLSASRLPKSPILDGDFSKWQDGQLYRLDQASQVSLGARRWKGPSELSARVALAWNESFLYVGVDVTDPDLYQPFFGRDIRNGDTFGLTLETGFRKNFFAKEPTGDEYVLFFSPGNFTDVPPSIFSDEDYLPPRAQPANCLQNILMAWKKTPQGYAGDIAIPASLFEGGKLAEGYEIGLGFSVRKVLRPAKPTREEDLERITLQSKTDHLFRIGPRNPSTFPRLVLVQAVGSKQ
jgi:hypothetical protein